MDDEVDIEKELASFAEKLKPVNVFGVDMASVDEDIKKYLCDVDAAYEALKSCNLRRKYMTRCENLSKEVF